MQLHISRHLPSIIQFGTISTTIIALSQQSSADCAENTANAVPAIALAVALRECQRFFG
jgi:hypothetical protein